MRILLLEDSADDADLLAIALEASGLVFELERAANEEQFLALLARFDPDIVVSDAHLPAFTYQEALALVRGRDGDIPFVVVSGIDERDLPARNLPHGADAWLCKDRMQDVAALLRELTQQDAPVSGA